MRSQLNPGSPMAHVLATGLLMAVAAFVSTATNASADDLLVMPYRCDMAGGRPVLSPSEQQGHAIIGRREQRNITICSPADPGRCRTWTAHRFEVSCGGVPVPWTAVVAGSPQARDGRAYVDGGRLRLRMPPTWSMEPGDPCARPLDQDLRGANGGLSRYCADRRALSQPAFVEMPAGFAPMLGLDGVFVAEAAPPARPDGNAALNWKATPQLSVPPLAQAIQPSLKKKRPEPEVVPPPAPSPGPALVQPPEPAPGPQREAKLAAAPPQTTPAAEQPIQPPAPAATSLPSPQPSAAPVAMAPPAPPESVLHDTAHRETTVGAQVAQSPPLPTPQPDPPSNPSSSRPMKIPGSEPTWPWLGMAIAAGLALTAWAAAVWGRRLPKSAPAKVFERDYAAFDLPAAPGAATSDDRPRDEARSFALTIPSRHDPRPAATDPASAPPAVWPTGVPRTRDDALFILGMGVNAQASETALKKIVDGLRLTWHPDHALTDADRATREQRIRQINAAWELISGKPPAEGVST